MFCNPKEYHKLRTFKNSIYEFNLIRRYKTLLRSQGDCSLIICRVVFSKIHVNCTVSNSSRSYGAFKPRPEFPNILFHNIVINTYSLREISGSRGGKYEDECPLGPCHDNGGSKHLRNIGQFLSRLNRAISHMTVILTLFS